MLRGYADARANTLLFGLASRKFHRERGHRGPLISSAVFDAIRTRRGIGTDAPSGRGRGRSFQLQRFLALFLDGPCFSTISGFEARVVFQVAAGSVVHNQSAGTLRIERELLYRTEVTFREDRLHPPRFPPVGGQ